MARLIECVPNFSEGRDHAILRQITAEIEDVEGAKLLERARTLDTACADRVTSVRELAASSTVAAKQLHEAERERFDRFLDSLGTAGNLVTDAQIAAIAIEHDAVVHTSDADFTRFPGLRWLNPVAAA